MVLFSWGNNIRKEAGINRSCVRNSGRAINDGIGMAHGHFLKRIWGELQICGDERSGIRRQQPEKISSTAGEGQWMTLGNF
jgi:hypothetical protein